MNKTLLLSASFAAATSSVFGAMTLDDNFGETGARIGLGAKEWDAKTLLGDNKGSVFFDFVPENAQEPLHGMRNLLCVRTASRTRSPRPRSQCHFRFRHDFVPLFLRSAISRPASGSDRCARRSAGRCSPASRRAPASACRSRPCPSRSGTPLPRRWRRWSR